MWNLSMCIREVNRAVIRYVLCCAVPAERKQRPDGRLGGACVSLRHPNPAGR